MMSAVETTVTWIKVEKPVFDLVGVVLGALSLAGVCVAVAVVLGGAFGCALIRRSRRRSPVCADVALHLR
jgi:hypothetical protein